MHAAFDTLYDIWSVAVDGERSWSLFVQLYAELSVTAVMYIVMLMPLGPTLGGRIISL